MILLTILGQTSVTAAAQRSDSGSSGPAPTASQSVSDSKSNLSQIFSANLSPTRSSPSSMAFFTSGSAKFMISFSRACAALSTITAMIKLSNPKTIVKITATKTPAVHMCLLMSGRANKLQPSPEIPSRLGRACLHRSRRGNDGECHHNAGLSVPHIDATPFGATGVHP